MKLFVWDFHGTLEKGNEAAVLENSNAVLEMFGYAERFSLKDCIDLYGLKWYEYFAFLLPHETKEKHLELQQAALDYQYSHPEIIARHIKPNDHAHEVLDAIAEKHYQIVVSNTSPSDLLVFLKAVEMVKYFPDGQAFGVDSHSPGSFRTKRAALEKILLLIHFEGIVTIGDSKDDIELASAHNGVSYLYAHPGKDFRDANAIYKIRDLRDILREI